MKCGVPPGPFGKLRVTGVIYICLNTKSGRSKPLPYVGFAGSIKIPSAIK